MSQQDIIDFVNDPGNIKKAVEGSMEKRNKVMANTNELDEAVTLFRTMVADLVNWHVSGFYGGRYEQLTPKNKALVDDIMKHVPTLVAIEEAAAIQAFGEKLLAKAERYEVATPSGVITTAFKSAETVYSHNTVEAVPITAIQEELRK